MLPGSKVVVVCNVHPKEGWPVIPLKKDDIYTIRDIFTISKLGVKKTGVYLEEVVNSIIGTGLWKGEEFGYNIEYFREIDALYDLLPAEKVANPEEHLILQPLELT